MILSSYHDDSCHIGGEKLYNTIRQKYYWPNLYVDLFNWARTCSACQRSKGNVTNKALLKPLSPPSTIFEVWHMDYVQFPRSIGFNYVLVLVDNFSLFSIFLPARTTGAAETARLLYDLFFMVYGAKTLLSDRGSCFRSKLVKSL